VKPFSSRTMTAADWKEIKHFRPSEFRRPSRMGYEFVKWLDAVREGAGVPMVITSSSRTTVHNADVGGATNSAHTDVPCNAVDVGERPRKDDPNWNLSRWAIVSTAIALGCKRIGLYADGSLHLDMTHDRRPAPRMWRVVGSI
jgi:hypothetical protein